MTTTGGKSFFIWFWFLTLGACATSSLTGNSKNKDDVKETEGPRSQESDKGSKNQDKDEGSDGTNTEENSGSDDTTSTDTKPFVGLWDATGYLCYDASGNLVEIPLEIIKIEEKDGKFIGTKVKGDDCVRTGQRTFEGTRKGREIEIKFYGGNPSSSQTVLIPETVSGLYEKDSIEIFSEGMQGPESKNIRLTRRKKSASSP